MNNITLYRSGAPLFNLIERGKRTVESANVNRAMLSDDSVSIRMTSREVLDFRINDYFILFESIYRINAIPKVQKISESAYEYDIKAEGLMFDLLRCKYFNADETDFKSEIEFPLIGTIETFLTCLKANMNRFSVKWEIGKFVNAETKSLTFSDDTCLSALQKICSEFKTDFWVKAEEDKFVIHTGDFGRKLPISFEYGKSKGLYSFTRSNADENNIINRLYVFGGSENIPSGYRNSSTKLLLPNADFLEDHLAIQEHGLKEGSINFDDIYPKRTGKITALGNSKFKFVDNTMDFDLNEKEADNITTKYLIAGTTAKVHFNTGNLAGYEFEIKKGGYDHATKTFEIIPVKPDNGQVFPDENQPAFQFEVGDEYVIIDIVMPQSYIDNAENKLLTEGTKQFDIYKKAKVSYDLEVDPEYMAKIGNENFDIGDYVTVFDRALNIEKLLRINQITVNFIENGEYNLGRYKISIADSYEIAYASQMILDIKDIKNILSIVNLGTINYSMLGMKTTQELRNLVFDTDDYFNPENIKPNSIETNMLTVGAQSQQISCSVVFELKHDDNVNKIKVNAGIVFSQTFDKEWNIPAKIETIPDNDFRYVYAKVDKSGTSGEVYFTKDQIKFDSDVNDYYFLLGILHTVVDGVRVLSITFGTTTINGGLIRTGTISSLDGSTTINLENGVIKGKIKFNDGSDGFTSIDNGVVVSQSVLVGDTQGVKGGITSNQQDNLGDNSVAFFFGSNYAMRGSAPFRVTQNGQVALESKDGMNVVKGLYLENGRIIWRDENGIIRRIIDMYLDQRFSANGTLLYEVNETGFHSYAVPESFISISIKTFFSSIEVQTNPELEDLLFYSITKTVLGGSGKYTHKRSITPNYNCWKYSPGNVDAANLPFEGFKVNNTDKTANIPDGWYTQNTGQLINAFSVDLNATFDITVPMIYIKNGKITQTRSITVNI